MKKIIAVLLIFGVCACASIQGRQPASEKNLPNDLSYYPKSYADSVKTFQALSQKIKSESPDSETGFSSVHSSTDNDLQTNFIFRPSHEGSDLLVITSGVHGAEAFAGSGVEQMFIQELLPRIDSKKMAVLVVHAVNPYGFKHFRRVNEHNIDLNRNFPADTKLYSMQNAGYEALVNLLEPKDPVSSPVIERIEKDTYLATGLIDGRYTVKELGDSIGQGQHSHPTGLEYGGKEPEPQVQIIKNLVQKYSAQYKRIVFIDIHTGLGSGYQLHMMTGDGISYRQNHLLQQLLKVDQDGTEYDLATGDDPGFYPTPGDIINFLPKIVAPDKESVAMTAEFGTVGSGTLDEIKTLNRLILENQGFQNGYSSADAETSIKSDFHELFFPTDPKWRTLVISKSRVVLTKIIDRMGDLKSE